MSKLCLIGLNACQAVKRQTDNKKRRESTSVLTWMPRAAAAASPAEKCLNSFSVESDLSCNFYRASHVNVSSDGFDWWHHTHLPHDGTGQFSLR